MKIEFEKLNLFVLKRTMVTARELESRLYGLKGRCLNQLDDAAICKGGEVPTKGGPVLWVAIP